MAEKAEAPCLVDPAWGPTTPGTPSEGHPLRNEAAAGRALGAEVVFAGARIDALILCAGSVLRTAEAQRVDCGLAQVRRLVTRGELSVVHLVFAPATPRPLLLGLVRLENHSEDPIVVDYSETWDVDGEDYRTQEGACVRGTPFGPRALADVATVIRSRPPAQSQRGLALDVRLALAPRSRRQLAFAYAAPRPDDDPALLVRAWRGGVCEELEQTVRSWLERLRGASADPIEAYRSGL